MHHGKTTLRRLATLVAVLGLAVAAAGCGDSGTSDASSSAARGGKRILPVAKNPISNAATAPGLTIANALVENNVDAETGKDVDDHLEITLENTTSRPLDDIEIYYKIIDKAKNLSEGYYSKLDGFVIPSGGTRVAHFDNTGQKDHFPVNEYSLYYVDANELTVAVTASSRGTKPATFTVTKDAADAEEGVD
jgi:hypothetical protein